MSFHSCQKRQHQRGIALVLTLAVLAVLSLIVIGFLVAMRTEQTAARAQTYILSARQLAQGAVDEAIFMLRTNTPVLNGTDYYVTQPGRAVRSGAIFDDRLFSVFTPLSSAGTVNINADQSIISSNSIYTTSSSRQMMVDWINVCTNGSSSGAALAGRYAYWVDDEASKLNINTANRRAATSASTNGVSPADVDLTAISGVGPVLADDTWIYGTNTGYFTTEQWKMTTNVSATTYGQTQVYITPYSIDQDINPWGQKRKNLNDPTGGLTRADVDSIDALTNQNLTTWFGTINGIPNTFARKYGVDCVKQILANIYDYRREAGGGSGTICTGAETAYLDGGGPGWLDVPLYYCGLRRYPFLNEVGVMASYCWPVATQIQAKVTIYLELVNPYDQPWGNGGEIRVTMDKLRFRINEPTLGTFVDSGPDTGWPVAWQAGVVGAQSAGELTVAITNNIPARGYAVYSLSAWAEQIETDPAAYVDQIGVRIAKVRLLQTPAVKETIRDWAIQPDFDQQQCAVGNFNGNHFCFTSVTAGGASIQSNDCTSILTNSNALTQSIAKNDPRVRTFTSWAGPLPAWYRVGFDTTTNSTIGAENVGVVNFTGSTGIVNLPKDPSDGAGYGVTNRSTIFAKTAAAGDVNYETTGELGFIHTGLQWRTLNLLPQSTLETTTSNYIPDWVVLDLFTVTNKAAIPGRININGVLTNWSSGAIPLRTPPVAGLGSNFNLTGVGPLNASDILTQRFTTAFSDRYYTNTFFSKAYTFAGQICEVEGLTSSSGTPKAQRESRIRSLANLITVRSDQFTVWGIAQSIQDVNNNGVFDPGQDVIAAESKVQAVVERYVESGQAKFRILYFRYYAE